jgi:hypothetical protein
MLADRETQEFAEGMKSHRAYDSRPIGFRRFDVDAKCSRHFLVQLISCQPSAISKRGAGRSPSPSSSRVEFSGLRSGLQPGTVCFSEMPTPRLRGQRYIRT